MTKTIEALTHTKRTATRPALLRARLTKRIKAASTDSPGVAPPPAPAASTAANICAFITQIGSSMSLPKNVEHYTQSIQMLRYMKSLDTIPTEADIFDK